MQQKSTKNEQHTKAMMLYRGGLSVTRIAEAIGVNRSTIHRWIKAELQQRTESEQLEIAHYRAIQLERYLQMFSALQGEINKGNVKAVSAGTNVLTRVDKLLGTEQPALSVVNSTVASTVETIQTPVPAQPPMTDEQFQALAEGFGIKYGTK